MLASIWNLQIQYNTWNPGWMQLLVAMSGKPVKFYENMQICDPRMYQNCCKAYLCQLHIPVWTFVQSTPPPPPSPSNSGLPMNVQSRARSVLTCSIRHHPVDQSHGQGFIHLDWPAGQHQVQGSGHADDLGQSDCTAIYQRYTCMRRRARSTQINQCNHEVLQKSGRKVCIPNKT